MEELKIGDTVLVEECWEDEGGNYHDELAVILSLEPLQLDWIDVTDEVREWLNSFEHEIEFIKKVE